MPIVLLSCYELGHQPLNLAWPLAALRAAGLDAVAVDLAVDDFPTGAIEGAQFVAISAPMHTALRLGVEAARRVREINPGAVICFYGLYAWMNRAYLLHGAWSRGQGSGEQGENNQYPIRNGELSGGRKANGQLSMGKAIADAVIAGEVEETLVELARVVIEGREATRTGAGRPESNGQLSIVNSQLSMTDGALLAGVTVADRDARPVMRRVQLPLPERAGLAALERYARYMEKGVARQAGYVEATRGCLHTCRHCPVVPIYKGRFFAVPAELVMDDVRQQVAAGAEHITFGDPDFLNGPGHALKIVRQMHVEFPALTFDFTTKVEHILEHATMMPELAASGATFVVSAFESTSRIVLERLHKGHTVADMEAALRVLRAAGIAPQPTWMPFTPWTSLEDYLGLLAWVRSQELIAHVPAVQLSIRMLVPPESALLGEQETVDWLDALDAENFTYRWVHPDPRMDALHAEVTRLAELADDEDPYGAFGMIEAAAYFVAGRRPPPAVVSVGAVAPPRLSEHWFC